MSGIEGGRQAPIQQYNYLFFTTTCEEALSFYSACGLGSATILLRYGENGMAATNPAMQGKVLHARFEGPGIHFYASDNDDAEPMRGSAHFLLLDDRASAMRLFKTMSEGGCVTTPLAVQAWGDLYGKFTDRFGVQWMLNCALPGNPGSMR